MQILTDLQADTTAPTIVIAAAMDMETAPLLHHLAGARTATLANQTWHLGTWNTGEGAGEGEGLDGLQVCVITTGIGLANAASAAARAHLVFENIRAYICAGTTGGLGAETNVRDVLVGTSFIYSRADATAFGYKPGQIPGLPEEFTADETLAEKARAALGTRTDDGGVVWFGQVSSSDAFVTAQNVERTRETFPRALGADMETTAAAQVCAASGVPFISVRAISDLCGPAANQDFHVDGSVAAEISANAVNRVLASL
ncbi:MAG: 5'-methylthioadenosine/S-adenosylhomocysteine nucleosidase [Actinomycetaceae bacterium]|nr:5'-methylthioadenosine/S-adenosylhomocysteine nucleosidase [Actinomycetaceae bacterium]